MDEKLKMSFGDIKLFAPEICRIAGRYTSMSEENSNQKKNRTKETRKGSAKQSHHSRNHVRWDKLDNTALLFPSIAGEDMTNVFRISVTLLEEIDPELLQEALDIVLPKFDTFNVRLRTGVFWYYFEENGKPAPKVVEENAFPCRRVVASKNNSYLFRVTYFRRRINLEVFHVLTDGMGGINFLRELTYQYLRLAHPELRSMSGDDLSWGTSLDNEDSFVRNYKSAQPSGFVKDKAYQIKLDPLPQGEFGVMHGEMSIRQLKAHCHEIGVSINDYLIGCFIWSVYKQCLKSQPSKKPIRVSVPINLRPYFDSQTTRNFFVMVFAEFRPEKDEYTFEEMLAMVREGLHKQMEKKHLEELFSYSVSNQKNLMLRPVPLFIKNPVMRLIYNKSAVANTTTITNIGNIKVDQAYAPYIDLFTAFIALSKGQFLKGCICSYGDRLNFTFSSGFVDTTVQKGFFRKITEDGIDVRLVTNDVFY